MRLPDEALRRALALGLTIVLAACGATRETSGGLASAPITSGETVSANGPAADYPVVLGESFTVEGQQFTPTDTLNYDEVGYAASDAEGGSGVTVAHKTLPLPSYVEITALEGGKTILARVERRGPMSASKLIALSAGAQAQLGVGEGAPLRVRRVNPPEADRALLRVGQAAPERMETPASLLAVLLRKLPQNGSASLASMAALAQAPVPQTAVSEVAIAGPAAASSAPHALTPIARVAAANQAAPAPSSDGSFAGQRQASTAYPLPPLATPARTSPVAYREPGSVEVPWVRTEAASPKPGTPPAPPHAQTTAPPASGDGFVVQAGAYSSRSNANRAARSIGGFVEQSGRVWRVRKGPFASRGQAEAALANIRAAGYSDARVLTTG